jgi:glycerol transport system ATP-binding protein
MTLALKNVEKRVGAEIHIHESSLELATTGFNVLLGATGAGKTTLIKLMAGLEKPTAGEIWLNGKDITSLSPQQRNVSLVHQFFINYPNLTVYENIASPLRVAGVGKNEIERRVGEIAELTKLTPMLKRRPSELSGGQQQRTALARAIVKDSKLVLLDEPLANLDYKLREELRDELPRLLAGRGTLVVYATSEPTEALLLGGHTATLHEGRITAFGETAAIYRSPGDLMTARVFSDPPINVADVRKQGGEMIMGDIARWPAKGAIAAAADGLYTVGVRPHFVTPTQEGADAVRLLGQVQVTEISGSESVAHFQLGDHGWVSQSHGVYPLQVGDHHEFFLNVDQCLYFGEDDKLIAAR